MTDIEQALQELKLAENAMSEADPEFADVAIHRLSAAITRYEILYKKVKEGWEKSLRPNTMP